MTQNQIAYQQFVEGKRANLAREAETNRSNLSQEQLKREELGELGRHNLVTESQGETRNTIEQQKADQTYSLGKERLAEDTRHNTASESNQLAIGYLQAVTSANNALLNASTSMRNTDVVQDRTDQRFGVTSGLDQSKYELEVKKYDQSALTSPTKALGYLYAEAKSAPIKGKEKSKNVTIQKGKIPTKGQERSKKTDKIPVITQPR